MYRDLRPDVAIIDLRLPGLSGLEVIAAIAQMDPAARLLALTSAGGDADVRSALDAGASGFLVKPVEQRALEIAVNSLLAARGKPATT